MTTKRYIVFFVFLLLIFLIFKAFPASAEIYKYIDRNGIIHYTDNLTTIPPEYQPQPKQYIEKMSPTTARETEATSEDRLSSGKIIQETTSDGTQTEVPEPGNHAITLSDSGVSETSEKPSDSNQSSDTSDKRDVAETESSIQENINDPRISGSDSALIKNSASELPSKASSEFDAIEPTTEQVGEVSGNGAESEQTRQLGEQRNELEARIKQLDHQYRTVLKERKRLEDQRQNLNSKSEIKSYNQQVQKLNDKIQEYRDQRQTLEFEVRVFNDSITR